MLATITELNVYPVKSCRGTALTQATLCATGIAHDREWLIVNEGRFVTQREEPRLALIEPMLGERDLTLRAPGMSELKLAHDARGAAVEVQCWNDLCAAFDTGEAAAKWLAEFLGKPYRLVRFDRSRKRISNRDWTGDIEALNQFSDGYPILVISAASLQDLNARLERTLPMNRFRPNIVIDGLPAYAEDRALEFATATVRLRAVKPCTRCIITTTEQSTGERDGVEPLRTLRAYRFSRELKGNLFGQNLILVQGVEQTLRVGEQFSVTWKEQEQ